MKLNHIVPTIRGLGLTGLALVMVGIATAAGYAAPKKQYTAPKFERPPVIDGKLDEWKKVPRLMLGPESAKSAEYGGASDLSADCRWAWDNSTLYFSAVVRDNDIRTLQDTGDLGSLWQYDSIQMSFDAGHNARTAGYDSDDYEYGFGLAGGKGRAYRWHTGNNLVLGDVPTITVAVIADQANHTLTYEVAIPWKELVPFSPETGICGMTIAVNDNDDGRHHASLEWTPGITNGKDPSEYGELVLTKSPPSGGGSSAWLLGEADLSGKNQGRFSVLVESPGNGKLTADWTIRYAGMTVRSGTAKAVSEGKIEILADVSDLTGGLYTVSAVVRSDGKEIARASDQFGRYDVGFQNKRLQRVSFRFKSAWDRLTGLQRRGRSLLMPQSTLATVRQFIPYTEEDLRQKRYGRAVETLDQLEKMLSEADNEITRLTTNPTLDFKLPRLGAERVTVKDGAFWSGGKSVFLIGFTGWYDVWGHMDTLAQLGISNSLENVGATPWAVFPKNDEAPAREATDALDWGWGWAAKAGCNYSRLLALNQLPGWFTETQTKDGGEGPHVLQPATRELTGKVAKFVASRGKLFTSTGPYVLFAEATQWPTGNSLEQNAFRDYLSNRYGSIEKLNSAWGASYSGFDQITGIQQPGERVAWYDRGRFEQKVFTDWNGWLAEQIRAEDPQALVTSYPSLLTWDDSSDFAKGIDMEALCQVYDANGCDTAGLEYGGSRWAMSSITGFAMLQDMLRAFNPSVPNFDPELHMVNSRRSYPAEYVRAAMFQGFLHGLSAADLWVMNRGENIDSMLCFQPRVMETYSRTGLQLQRLVEPVRAFQRAPEEVGIMYSLTSVGYNSKHLAEMRAAYEGLFFLDAKCRFVTDRTVLTSGLVGLKVLILPRVSHLPGPAADAILAWVRKGGAVLALGDCFTHDDLDRPLVGKLSWPTTSGQIRLGRGRMVYRPTPPEDWEAYNALGEKLFSETGVSRPIRAERTDGKPAVGIELRTTVWNGHRLVYLINMNNNVEEVRLRGVSGPARDLITGRIIGWPCRIPSPGVLLLDVSRE